MKRFACDRRRALALAPLAAAFALLGACSPVERNHGQVWSAYDVGDVQPGRDDRDSVRRKLGSPSAREVSGDSVWVYVSSKTRSVLGGRPEVLERRIVALEFDGGGTLASLDEYTLEDGRLVPINPRITPTAGRKLNLIQQLLGNVGRFESGDGY